MLEKFIASDGTACESRQELLEYEAMLKMEKEKFTREVVFFDSALQETFYENALYVLIRSVQGVEALKRFCEEQELPTIWQDDFGDIIAEEEPGFYIWDDDNDEWKKEHLLVGQLFKNAFN